MDSVILELGRIYDRLEHVKVDSFVDVRLMDIDGELPVAASVAGLNVVWEVAQEVVVANTPLPISGDVTVTSLTPIPIEGHVIVDNTVGVRNGGLALETVIARSSQPIGVTVQNTDPLPVTIPTPVPITTTSPLPVSIAQPVDVAVVTPVCVANTVLVQNGPSTALYVQASSPLAVVGSVVVGNNVDVTVTNTVGVQNSPTTTLYTQFDQPITADITSIVPVTLNQPIDVNVLNTVPVRNGSGSLSVFASSPLPVNINSPAVPIPVSISGGVTVTGPLDTRMQLYDPYQNDWFPAGCLKKNLVYYDPIGGYVASSRDAGCLLALGGGVDCTSTGPAIIHSAVALANTAPTAALAAVVNQ